MAAGIANQIWELLYEAYFTSSESTHEGGTDQPKSHRLSTTAGRHVSKHT